MNDAPTYVLERNFDAPRDLVWKAWTDPELLTRWYGPRVETIVHRYDLRPGGLWLGEMRWDGNSNFQRVEFLEVTPTSRLVWLHAVSDDEWNVVDNPMMENWPRLLLTTVTFESVGQQTLMRLTWAPHEAGEAEIACFSAAMGGMDKGWSAGMELLAELLAQMQAP